MPIVQDDGDGASDQLYVTGFALSDTETDDLIAFLESLTDEAFVHDPRLGDPWR